MKNTSIYFINHSSFQIIKKDKNLLIDPWFSEKVFNNSWSLLKEGHIGLKKGITHIFISHEHPDHLHFATLKYLKESDFLTEDCILIFPFRNEKSVKNAIEKLKIKFLEIKDGKQNLLSLGDIDCTYYGENEMGDHSMVFDCKDIKILNQNDHYTSIPVSKQILKDWKNFDIMFTQFSIAGYHGNKNDSEVIKNNGTFYHLDKVRDYGNIFKPKYLIPFASYVYFCDNYNNYLNDYIVKFNELSKIKFLNSIFQFVNFGDEILLDDSLVKKRNLNNLNILINTFNKKNFQIYKAPSIDPELIVSKIKKHCKSIDLKYWLAFRFLKKRLRGEYIVNKKIKMVNNPFANHLFFYKALNKLIKFLNLFKLIGINGRYMYIKLEDFEDIVIRVDIIFFKKVDIVKNIKKIDFIIPSNQIDFALKFPWGVDTLNVTATGQYFSALPDIFMRLVHKNNLRV